MRSDDTTGELRVFYPNPVPEVVFESPPDYSGATGLWAVAARPSEAAHALVVLSFVAGSRALSIAGEPPTGHALSSSPDMMLRTGVVDCAVEKPNASDSLSSQRAASAMSSAKPS